MAIKKVGTEYKEIKPIATNIEQFSCNCCGTTFISDIHNTSSRIIICEKCKATIVIDPK